MEINERVHAYLDGDLARESLTPGERDMAHRIEGWTRELRADAEVEVVVGGARTSGAQDLASRVMDELISRPVPSAASTPARTSLARWLFGRRRISFDLRPVYAVAALLILAAGIGFGLPSPSGGSGEGGGEVAFMEGPSAASGPTVFVRFELAAPEARSVQLAGSFSGWSADISLEPIGDGRWSALVPLRPGVHDYAFRIDGERWVVDPYSPRVADGFGGYNSRLSLVVSDS